MSMSTLGSNFKPYSNILKPVCNKGIRSNLSISGSLLEYVINAHNLNNCEKLYYINVTSLSSIENHKGRSGVISISSANWATRLSCSKSKVFTMQKSLEEKGYFIVTKEKNNKGQHKRNMILPTLPDHVFEQLTKSANRNENLYLGVKTKNLNVLEDNLSDNKINYLNQTKLFIKINYHLLRSIISAESLTNFAKVLFLDFYVKAYKSSCYKSKDKSKILDVIVDYKVLIENHGCNKSGLSRAISNLKENGLISCKRLRSKQSDEELAINDRADKSLWQISLNLNYPEAIDFKNQSNDINNKSSVCENNENSSNSNNYEVAHISQHSNNKDIILNNIDIIDVKTELSELSEFNKIKKYKDDNIQNIKKSILTKTSISFEDIEAITETEAEDLRVKSGRDFNLNFMNQLLLKLKIIKDHYKFANKYKFLSYFAKILKYEKREEMRVNTPFYQMKDNLSSEHPEAKIHAAKVQENKKMEYYLQTVEDSKGNSLQEQLRRKIAGSMDPKIAYALLANLQDINQTSFEEVTFSLNKSIEELATIANDSMKSIQEKLLYLLKSVYGSSVNLVNFNVRQSQKDNTSNELSFDTSTIWGKVREGLSKLYHSNIDKNWFSKLESFENQELKQISLKAPNSFKRDWINQHYYSSIQDICRTLGWTLEEKIIT